MKIYALTRLGKQVAKSGEDGKNPEEMAILKYLRSHKTADDDEIEVNCGNRWLLRGLKRRGLIQELTA